jgi:hypothetical protein
MSRRRGGRRPPLRDRRDAPKVTCGRLPRCPRDGRRMRPVSPWHLDIVQARPAGAAASTRPWSHPARRAGICGARERQVVRSSSAATASAPSQVASADRSSTVTTPSSGHPRDLQVLTALARQTA